METWLEQRIEAVKVCLQQNFAEAALALIYSGIDTMAFWAAPEGQEKVEKSDFIAWCDEHVVPLLGPADVVNGHDLYGARCGILHTSSSTSQMSRSGEARELYYKFEGRVAINLRAATPLPSSYVHVEALCRAFEVGGRKFLTDLRKDSARLTIAKERAMYLFTWGVLTS